MFCTFTMKVSPAIIVIVMAGFCQANHKDGLSNNGYRCPVKNKFLNRVNAFGYIQDTERWQACGKNISEEYIEFIKVIFQEKSVTVLMAMAMAMAFALFGAYTGRHATSSHLVLMRTRKISRAPLAEKEDVVSKTLNLNFI